MRNRVASVCVVALSLWLGACDKKPTPTTTEAPKQAETQKKEANEPAEAAEAPESEQPTRDAVDEPSEEPAVAPAVDEAEETPSEPIDEEADLEGADLE